MNKLIFVNPNVRGEYFAPKSKNGFSLIFDTQASNWQQKLKEMLSHDFLPECRLFCLYGPYSKKAEDYVDDWLVDQHKNALFFQQYRTMI